LGAAGIGSPPSPDGPEFFEVNRYNVEAGAVIVGIAIWRKRVFSERPRVEGRMTLPAMTTAAILGLW
jgi:hypothetical protein